MNSSDNFQVDGITVRHTRGWANTLTNCTNSGYDNVKVFTYQGVWGLDGIDPVSCKGFTINDCFIRTRDDCIAIKSNGRRGTADYDLSTRDITITKSVFVGWDHADGVTLGFELTIYGDNGYIYQRTGTRMDTLIGEEFSTDVDVPKLEQPYNDAFRYLKAVVRGDIKMQPYDGNIKISGCR